VLVSGRIDPLGYDRLVRRFQSASEREAEGKRKGYAGVLEADMFRAEARKAEVLSPTARDKIHYARQPDGTIVGEEIREPVQSREEGEERWRAVIEEQFVAGKDEDFEYGEVDSNEEYDDWVVREREAEEGWFAEESPKWEVGEEGVVEGETGVQDF
jgi:hypothetical protein